MSRNVMPVTYPATMLLLLTMCVPDYCHAEVEESVRLERRLGVMGTTLVITVDAVDRATALAASERALSALETTEHRLSTWKTGTELGRLNHNDRGRPFDLSDKLAKELHAVRHWWRETDGAFDPAIGALVSAWGLRTGGRRPVKSEIQKALESCGMLYMDFNGRTASRLRSGLQIEEGGFGKGAGLDSAMEAVRGEGVYAASIDLGGQIAVQSSRKPMEIGLADPRRRDSMVIKLSINEGSLATSGNSERGIEVDGVSYSHILDPRSGFPAPDFGTITVFADDSLTADCLSTGLFVMGPESAIEWVSCRSGIEAVVLQTSKEGIRARITSGLADQILDVYESVNVEIIPSRESR
jgi:FAD:protein FMN transferase